MKMKKITVGFSLLALSALLFNCKKEKNVPPEADTETETAVQASWAFYAIADVEQMCAFMGENQLGEHFYKADPGVPTSGTVTATRDTSIESLNMSFNVSSCADGRLRNGTVFMDYGYSEDDYIKGYYTLYGIPDNKPRFYHEYGFLGRLTFSQYHVDGWTIVTDSIAGSQTHGTAVVYNMMGKSNYDPAKEVLKWRIVGSFVLYKPTITWADPNVPEYMTLTCDVVKSLTNSTSLKTFSATVNAKNSPITWSVGVVSYSGKISGTTLNREKFSIEISEDHPLVRDFTCFPDKVGNVAVGTGTQALISYNEEFHPFVSGIASFTTASKGKDLYPRKIYYGNEGNLELAQQCDNTGEVLIKGVSYRVNFWK